ncbi:MAG: hypothetical protein EPO26_01630 [Chloroflexota bacterium]|nr:MAG: hypothetical protein EPO26_01630 [Chloroflexota bacterium]
MAAVSAGGANVLTQGVQSGRLEPAATHGIDHAVTACYTCTQWRECLVFISDSGIRIALCAACLPSTVDEAVATRSPPRGDGRVPVAANR